MSRKQKKRIEKLEMRVSSLEGLLKTFMKASMLLEYAIKEAENEEQGEDQENERVKELGVV